MIKLVYCVRRRDDWTFKAFSERWLKQHGPLVRRYAEAIRARRYVQSHLLVSDVNEQLRASRDMRPAYDGITEVWWDSLDDLTAGIATPEGQAAGQALIDDEADFIDLKRSRIFLTEEHTIFDL